MNEDYLRRAGLIILIMITVVLSVAYVKNLADRRMIKIIRVPDSNIPSQREIQQRLTDLDDPRYDPGKIDGIISTDSRTAWDNYSCDRYAIQDFKGESK